jgi:hypothetical protein
LISASPFFLDIISSSSYLKIENMNCAHPDVRTFHNLRCCLSCGLAVHTTCEDTGSDEDTHPKTPINQDARRLTSRYVFKKLNYSLGQEIRLVLLQSDSYHEDLRCKIIHVNIDDNPEFDAVSYTRAGQDGKIQMDSRVICQGGLEIPISTNCDAVLRRIRVLRGRTPLWIDMLCMYSNRSRTKSLRNLRCLFPLEEPNRDRENLLSAFSKWKYINTSFYLHPAMLPSPRLAHSSYQYGHLSLF